MTTNPFPGLRPFRMDEYHLFFGREEQTAALLSLLRQQHFLAVVGTSGSGKSSLVRAGLIPSLHRGAMASAGSHWEVAVMRPGGDPLSSLAQALVSADLYDADDAETLPRLRATLSHSDTGLAEAIRQSDVVDSRTKVFVLVDQFEELFRFRERGRASENAASAFVDLLLSASESSENVFIAITMRSDYLGECSQIPGLAEAVNRGEYLIPRLSRDQRRDAIEKPVNVGGAEIAPGLVEEMLNSVGDDADQLPVLQHALMRTWDVWAADHAEDEEIGLRHFESTGGMAEALSRHADEIFDSLPTAEHRRVCRRLFRALTEKGSDNRGIRRPTRLEKLARIAASASASLVEVLDAFRQPGVTFLMPGGDRALSDQTVIDLSHESLMRGWGRLRNWVEEESQSARIFKRLLDTAGLWRVGKAGLFRDPDLQIALSWRDEERPNADWAKQYGGDFDTAVSFLEKSAEEAAVEQRAAEDARQRELEQARELAETQRLRLEQQQLSARKQRVMIAGLSIVAIIAGLAFIFALVANNRANILADLASQESAKARLNAAEADRLRATAQDARAQMKTERDNLARRYYLMHLSSANQAVLQNNLPRAVIELDQCDEQYRGWEWRFLDGRSRNAMGDPLYGRHRPCFTSDGQRLIYRGASPNQDKAIVWDLSSGRRLSELSHEGELTAVALSSDDQWLAAGQRDGVLVLWNLETQQQKWAGPVHSRECIRLAFSPDGSLIATCSKDGTLKVTHAADGTVKFTLPLDSPRGVTFSSNGRWLSVFADTSVLVNVTTGEMATRFPPAVVRPTFSPQGSLIATGNAQEQAITLWNWDGKELTQKKSWKGAASSRFQDLVFHPDGNHLVSAQGKHVTVWDVATGKALAGIRTREFTWSLSVSPKGHTIACSDWRGIHLWRYTGRDDRLTVRPHENASQLVQFSPDGRMIAVGSHRGQQELSVREFPGPVVILDSRTGQRISTIPVPCRGFSWMPDNQRIVVTRDPEAIHELYDAATGALVGTFEGGGAEGRPYVDQSGQRVTSVGKGNKARFAVRTWDVTSMQPGEQYDLRLFWGGGNPVLPFGGFTSATVGPDGHRVALGSGATGRVWDLRTGSEQELKLRHRIAETLAFTPDGDQVYATTGREHFELFNIDSKRPINRFVGPSGEAAMSRDQRYIVSSGEGVVIWDVESGIPLMTLSREEDRDCISVDWSADGQRIAAGRSDGTVHIWTLVTDMQLFTDQARAHEKLREWEAAAAKWSRAVDGNPNGARIRAAFAERLEVRGESLLAANQRELSRTLLEAALQADPGNRLIAERLADFNIVISLAHARNGRVNEATTAVGRALDQAASRKAIKNYVAQFEGFAPILTNLFPRRSENSQRHLVLVAGIADLFAADQDWKRAIVYYDMAIAQAPSDAAVLTRRAVAHAEAGELKQAADDWKRALELSPDATLNTVTIERAIQYGAIALKKNLLIPASAAWHFDDTGKDLGTEWREPGYNDSTWKKGPAPLGYGDDSATTLSDGEAETGKHSCYYFRREFDVNLVDRTNVLLLLRLLIDDGCVVYLNGQEVVRQNMPQGEISHDTWASEAINDAAERAWTLYLFSAAGLANGRNLLAVEVHQKSATSTDLRFDLELPRCEWRQD